MAALIIVWFLFSSLTDPPRGKSWVATSCFAPGQGALGRVPADQGVIAAVFLDQHRPFHRHVHHRGGKGLVIIPHAAEESHPRG